jgi:hypothetical protein
VVEPPLVTSGEDVRAVQALVNAAGSGPEPYPAAAVIAHLRSALDTALAAPAG